MIKHFVWSYSLIKDSLNKGEKRSFIWDRRILGHRYTKASKNPGWMGRKSNKTSLRGLILSPGTSGTVRGAFPQWLCGSALPSAGCMENCSQLESCANKRSECALFVRFHVHIGLL